MYLSIGLNMAMVDCDFADFRSGYFRAVNRRVRSLIRSFGEYFTEAPCKPLSYAMERGDTARIPRIYAFE